MSDGDVDSNNVRCCCLWMSSPVHCCNVGVALLVGCRLSGDCWKCRLNGGRLKCNGRFWLCFRQTPSDGLCSSETRHRE